MARWPWHSVLRILAILSTCFYLDSDASLVSSAVGSVCDAGPGPLLFRRPFEEELCDVTRDAAAVEATLSTVSGKREIETQGNPEPTTSSHLDPTRVASESTCGDCFCSSRTFPPPLESHDVGVRGSEADEQARGGSTRHQGFPSFIESIVEPSREDIQQSIAAGNLITNLGETDTLMTVAAVEGTGVRPELGRQGDDGRLTEIGKAVGTPSHESGSVQEPLPGAVKTFEFTASEIMEASASHDEVTCEAHKEGYPDAGKGPGSGGGVERAALELQLVGDDTVDLETGPRKRDKHCCSRSLSCLIDDHCRLPAAVVETGAQERGSDLLEERNTLGIDTDIGGAVETIEAISEIQEASASGDLVICDARYDSEKGDSSNSDGGSGGRASATTDLPLWRDESGPRQKIPDSDLKGFPSDIPGPFLSPAADVEAGTQERKGRLDAMNTLIIDTTARDLEDIEFTVPAIPETSASRDTVSSVIHQEGDPHAGKDLGSSTGGGESAKLELPLEGGHTVELETGQDLHAFSESWSRTVRDAHLSPAFELEPEAEELRVTIIEADGSKILGVEADAGVAVEAMEFTASKVLEAAASHDIVICDAHQEGDPDAEKCVSSSISGEDEDASALKSDDAIELQTGPLEQGVLSHSGSMSSPIRDPDHFPTAELEAGAKEQEGMAVKGEESNILDVDTYDGRAAETIEFTVTEIPEASIGSGKDPVSTKDENLTLETPLEGEDEVELEAGAEKREVTVVEGDESCSLSIDTDVGGSVETIEFTVTETPEASASRDIDTYDARQEGVPDAGKDISGGKAGAVFETAAEKKTDPLVKGDGRDTLAVDAGDGNVFTGDVAGETDVEDEVVKGVLSKTTLSPWTQWACATLLCVTLVGSYAYAQGKLPRWLPFNGGDPYEGWARDLDTAIATARSRAGSLCATTGRTSLVNDLALPDLVAEDEPFTLSDEIQGDGASDRPRPREDGTVKKEGEDSVLMWDTRPKSPDCLVFDPVLGVVPWGILDAWARAEREGGGGDGGSRSRGEAVKVAADPDGFARGACCGNRTPLERREKKKRALPPVRYTPEWHAWRKAREDSVPTESAREESVRAESVRVESVDTEETEGEKGPKGLCPGGGEDEVVEGAAAAAEVPIAAAAVALGKKGRSFVPKTWTPAAIDSQFEGVVDGAGGATERNGGCGEDEAGKFVEFSKESREGDDSDARPSERCSAPVSTTSPEASAPSPPAVQTCL